MLVNLSKSSPLLGVPFLSCWVSATESTVAGPNFSYPNPFLPLSSSPNQSIICFMEKTKAIPVGAFLLSLLCCLKYLDYLETLCSSCFWRNIPPPCQGLPLYLFSYYVSGSLSIFHYHKNVLSLTQVTLQIFTLPSLLHFLKGQTMSLEPTSFLSGLMGCMTCTLNQCTRFSLEAILQSAFLDPEVANWWLLDWILPAGDFSICLMEIPVRKN